MSAADGPLVLGIETSCDETGVGIVRGRRLLANTVASSMAQHAPFGGVIPEIAARAHLEAMAPTLEEALRTANVDLADLDAIAVTGGPGLAGALMVGVAAAKALALAAGKPLYAVNHLVAHVGVGLLETAGEDADLIGPDGRMVPGLGALLVSGGHTEILAVSEIAGAVEMLGSTIDDAAGEAYDKVARLLDLAYPGGPAIDAAARDGDPQAIRFPRGLSTARHLGSAQEPGPRRHDFSFSGLKTAVARVVEAYEAEGREVPVADVAASFQESVVEVLADKTMRAAQDRGMATLLLGGGVAANSRLREVMGARCRAEGIRLVVPPLSLCTDNGAMVAALGSRLVTVGVEPSGLGFAADPGLPVSRVSLPTVG